MNYHPDDFIALSQAVEEEGGRLRVEPCEGEVFKLKQPDTRGQMVWRGFHTTHCGQSALMDLPYDPTMQVRLHDDEQDDVIIIDHPGEPVQYEEVEPRYTGALTPKTAKSHLVRVCAVDDAIGLWPRYAGVVTTRSYQTP